MSGFEHTQKVAVDSGVSLPTEGRRLKWPAAAALILVISTLLWLAIIQSVSWLGVF